MGFNKGSVKLVFPETFSRGFWPEGVIPTDDLCDFILLFRTAYGCAFGVDFSDLDHYFDDGRLPSIDLLAPLAGSAPGYFAEIGDASVDHALNEHYETDDFLVVQSMSKQSPLELVFFGAIIPLIAAIIISGGKLKIGGVFSIEAQLPPIGSGIKALKDALFTKGKTEVAYRIRKNQPK